jgi:hypothetical protein
VTKLDERAGNVGRATHDFARATGAMQRAAETANLGARGANVIRVIHGTAGARRPPFGSIRTPGHHDWQATS